MFKIARIKLTAWYLLIIMGISLFFSLSIYRITTAELNRMERMRRPRFEESFLPRIRFSLIIINLFILSGSAALAWFLSGKTLSPIKEMLDEQTRFITDASHELKTPLTALKAEIEVNLRNKKLTLSQAKALLNSNLEETNKLQTLSENLLKLSRAEKLIFQSVDTHLIAKEAIGRLKSLAVKKHIQIINRVYGIVKGDKIALTALLVIFLDNSIKYSRINTKIWLTSMTQGKNLEISVKDQGMGISQKDLPHLFKRFYRADQSRSKNSAGGYGLGLAIAKKIIDQHKGIIKVNSRLNQGTTFKLFLSLA